MSETGKVSAGAPTRLRTFDPVRVADFEYRAWVGYYLRQWPRVLIASVGLVRVGFGMDWFRTVYGAWLVFGEPVVGAISRERPEAGAELHAAVLRADRTRPRRARQPGQGRRA